MQPTLSEKSYHRIREKLTNGELSPGDRLVTRTIADEIGVSLGPVREAINRLSAEGLVAYVPGLGASVRKPNRRDLEELYILRQANEGCAASEAAKYITEDQLELLDTILDDAKAITEQIRNRPKKHASSTLADRWLDNDEHFHEAIVDASCNRLLIKVTREYRAIRRIFETHRKFPEVLTLQVAEDTCLSHQRLINSLRDRNPELSRQIMVEQTEKGLKTLLAHLNSVERMSRGQS
jgi:DNA-binding GntR family transcriptional regulator